MIHARSFEYQGNAIFYAEQGDSSLQTVLLVHGWSSSWYAMAPLMSLISRRFHCVVVNLPGYGNSPRFKHQTTIAAYADLLAQFIRETSDGPAVVVGHSMGGMIAIALSMSHPTLVERMVLLNPTITGRLSLLVNAAISPVTLMERFGFGSSIVAFFERTFGGITDMLMRPVSFAAEQKIEDEHYQRLKADARKSGQGRVRAECFWAMRDSDLQGRLHSVTVPALVIWGAEDNTVPLRDAGVIAREWPDADLRILPNAGHWPHFEQPGQTKRLIASYLGIPRGEHEKPITAQQLISIQEVAEFLSNSEIGSELNFAQRMRLAAQFKQHIFSNGESIVEETDIGTELYLVKHGTVEVWRSPEDVAVGLTPVFQERVSVLRPGQITGEVAMVDEGERSAALIAGQDGAVVLSLDRDRLLSLCEDDAVLGTRILWNIARAMTRRMRFMLWQLDHPTLNKMAQIPPAKIGQAGQESTLKSVAALLERSERRNADSS